MKIAVCLKHVPDPTTVEVDPLTGAIDESRLLYIMNPADASALELALRLRGEAGMVSALAVGPVRAEAALRSALATGADRVLRLWDEGWIETAPFSTAVILAAALRAEGLPDLILCGARSVDRGTGQVPAMLAEILGWPVVTDVTHFEIHADEIFAQRRLDRGAREVVKAALPTVLALEPSQTRLRYASLPRLMAAQRAIIAVLRPVELGLSASDLASPAPVTFAVLPPHPRPRAIFVPDSSCPPHERIGQILTAGMTRKSGRVIEGPSGQMAAAILAFLRERGFVEDPLQEVEAPSPRDAHAHR